MLITASKGMPELNSSPLASVICNCPKVIVEADDVNEARIRLTFSPYQAIKMITFDCFDLPDGVSIIPHTVMEIKNSQWLHELRIISKLTDCEAGFMDKAKHFLLPLEDDFLEIVAWSVEVEHDI